MKPDSMLRCYVLVVNGYKAIRDPIRALLHGPSSRSSPRSEKGGVMDPEPRSRKVS